MRLTAKRLRLALRSPANFWWSVRHVVRNSPLGGVDRLFLNGYAFRPSLLSVNITSRCNLRCDMCMQPRDEGDGSATLSSGRGELTPEQWCDVVDQAASARPGFYFTGGEPLLYRGLDRVLSHIKRRGMIAAIVTNATALRQHAERLVATGLDNVTVSLDGPEAVHDRIRGVEGAFRRAIEGIDALHEARRSAGASYPAVKVNCVITPDSIDTLEETYEIVRDLGVAEVRFQHPMFDTAEKVALHNRVFAEAMGEGEVGESKREGEFYELRLGEAEFERLERGLERLVSRRGGPRVMFFPSVARNRWRGYYLDLTHPFKELCTAPWTRMRLLADGKFEPCLHYVVGNVVDQPLWELWNGDRMRRFRRAVRRARLFPACARCCYRHY